MNNDIYLPPLPNDVIPGLADWIDDVRRAAVRYDRERRAKQEAKPVVHSTTLRLCPDGYAWRGTDVEAAAPGYGVLVDLRWTADGRVWIASDVNRVLAQKLRANGYLQAADALDGGER